MIYTAEVRFFDENPDTRFMYPKNTVHLTARSKNSMESQIKDAVSQNSKFPYYDYVIMNKILKTDVEVYRSYD